MRFEKGKEKKNMCGIDIKHAAVNDNIKKN